MAPTKTDYDAIVVGAGFGGLYQLKLLRDNLKFSVKGIEKAAGVGGTWVSPLPFFVIFFAMF